MVAAIAMGMGMGVGPAIAQENATNATDGPTIEPDSYDTQAIDTETRITDWRYSSGRFEIDLEADEPTTISMTEAGGFEEGTGSFNYREVRLDEGTQTITFNVADRNGAAVAIATRQSLEQGTGAVVSTGNVEKNPFRHFGGESGLFTGVIMTTVFAALGAAYVIRSEDSGVIEA